MKLAKTLTMLGALLVIAAMPVMGQTLPNFAIDDALSVQVVPVSIPFDATGAAPEKLAFARMAVSENNNNTGNLWEIFQVGITLSGSIAPADVNAVYVYYEPQNGGVTNDGLWSGGVTETLLVQDLAPVWTGNTTTVSLGENLIDKNQGGLGWAFFYAVLDLKPIVDNSDTIAAQFSSIAYGAHDVGIQETVVASYPTTVVNSRIDDYGVTVVGNTADLNLTTASPGTAVTALKLTLVVPDADLAAADIVVVDSLTVKMVGTGADSDIQPGGVRLFSDLDLSGTFNAGDIEYGTGTFGVPSAGYAEIVLTTPITLSDTDTVFYVALSVDSLATVGNEVGLQLEAPVTDIGFADSADDLVDVPSLLVQYPQVGFVDAGYEVPTPTTPDTFIIEEGADTDPPTVFQTVPAHATVDQLRDVVIEVLFDEEMTPVVAGDLTVVGSTSLGIDTILDGTYTFDTVTNASFTFAKTTPYAYSETVTVTVSGTVQDDASIPNAMGSDYVFTFDIEPPTPPEVTTTSPLDGTLDVARDTAVTVVFSEPMDLATLIDANFDMVNELDTSIPGEFDAPNDQTITFTPTGLLEYDTTFTVNLDSAAILDAEGEALDTWAGANPYSFQFKTVANVPPLVLVSFPTDGTADASIATTVSIVFSKAMDEATVTADANFSLTQTGEIDEIAGALSYIADDNTMIFTPDASLAYGTNYTGTVTTGMIDTEGSALAADHTFSFTTVSAAASLSFTDIIVANNRIGPGSPGEMEIFIETPADLAATDIVTIQVYTSTGRRVATLTTAGETYADVIARQPILWDGTNDREQPLGPGLYFVQVSSAGYRRALRVMIVR